MNGWKVFSIHPSSFRVREQRGLLLALFVFIHKVRQPDAREPVPRLRPERESLQQLHADLRQVGGGGGWGVGGKAAGGGLELAGAELHRHRAADHLLLLQRVPELLRLLAQVVGHLVQRDVLRERVLARPRLALARRHDGRLVDAAGELPEAGAPFAEARDELLIREALQIVHRRDAHLDQHGLGRLADAGDLAHGEADQEALHLVGADHEAAVRLLPVRGDLGEELVGGDAGGGGERRLRADLAADRLRGLRGGGDAGQLLRHVEVRLVEGARFDQRRVALEEGADLVRDGAVLFEIRRDEDAGRAEALRARGGHGGVDAELARLVGPGADHAPLARPADDHRLAAQRGVVALLHRRIECVHIDMDDLAHLPTTPAFIVDRKRLQRNCDAMRVKAAESRVAFRPHVKTHKVAEIGRMQHGGAAGPITVSTLAEAEHFAAAGFRDITYAVPIAPEKLPRAAALAAKVERLNILLDSFTALQAVESFGTVFDAFLKIDCGYHRAGVEIHDPDSLRLALAIARSPMIRFQGLLTHAGHSYNARDEEEVRRIAAQEAAVLTRFRALDAELADVTRSVGSTPTASVVDRFAECDEVRPGNYVFYDAFQAKLGSCSPDEVALAAPALRSIPNHSCLTAALYDTFQIVDGQRIVNEWRPVRGW